MYLGKFKNLKLVASYEISISNRNRKPKVCFLSPGNTKMLRSSYVVGIQYLDIDILLTSQVCLFTVESIKNNHIYSIFIQSTGNF